MLKRIFSIILSVVFIISSSPSYSLVNTFLTPPGVQETIEIRELSADNASVKVAINDQLFSFRTLCLLPLIFIGGMTAPAQATGR